MFLCCFCFFCNIIIEFICLEIDSISEFEMFWFFFLILQKLFFFFQTKICFCIFVFVYLYFWFLRIDIDIIDLTSFQLSLLNQFWNFNNFFFEKFRPIIFLSCLFILLFCFFFFLDIVSCYNPSTQQIVKQELGGGAAAAVLQISVSYPFVVTLHANNTIRVLNLITQATEKTTVQDARAIHALLVDSMNVVCVTPYDLQIWKTKNLTIQPRLLQLT